MKIIVGMDESSCSTTALDFVRQQDWPIGSRVIVVSVAVPKAMVVNEVYAATAAVYEQACDDRRRVHEELVARAELSLRETGLRTEARVLDGDPADMLIDLAKRERADLIVVGCHDRTGLNRLLIGSVASHVVTHAPCSVLVARRKRAS